ncbi:MurR/RpiR family transcriptional regulator [Phytomonospora endophytica]|uniref:DNA-binding MurR/RpiR family transcriptional regulator n=1 Tax=Phytomonospora endophytica TaxID=714109 RepID=A0A841G3E9_9ACTN|nr:MurR/RpiR family transcriptional regulator [Phytomonospora endophytica]MBB6039239.1 DNA-binding MurR/RpiR family transcriptional regulator [Phytomonospora endophytica]GIG67524.1 RpiR family transcriptional regulator [Phytomonospora endophytica]
MSAPTVDLIAQIRGVLPSLPKAEQRVATTILGDPAALATYTITDLAAAAHTSEATVIRFCRSIGLSGHRQLRLRAAEAVARRPSTPDPKVVGGDIPAGADMPRIIATIGFHDTRAVSDTVEQLDPEVCTKVVDALATAGRVDVFGVGASGFVAADFHQKLHRIARTANCWTDVHSALTGAALLKPGDVAFGITHTGETHDIVDVLRLAAERGVTTVALTNFPRSTVSGVVDHVLTTAAGETTYRSGATASRIAQLTVIDCLFVGLAARGRQRAADALAATAAAVRDRRRSSR